MCVYEGCIQGLEGTVTVGWGWSLPLKAVLSDPSRKKYMVVSQNEGTPIQTPIYYSPYYGDPQRGTINLGKLPYIMVYWRLEHREYLALGGWWGELNLLAKGTNPKSPEPYPKAPRTFGGFREDGLGFGGEGLGSHYEGPRALG